MSPILAWAIGLATGAFLVWVTQRNETRRLQHELRFAKLDYDLKRIKLGLEPADG